jgi:hypothetical protein
MSNADSPETPDMPEFSVWTRAQLTAGIVIFLAAVSC